MYCWGGYIEHLQKDPHQCTTIPKSSQNLHDPSALSIYDPLSKTWRFAQTYGDIPKKALFSANGIHQHHLYVFGGMHYLQEA